MNYDHVRGNEAMLYRDCTTHSLNEKKTVKKRIAIECATFFCREGLILTRFTKNNCFWSPADEDKLLLKRNSQRSS